MGSSTCAVDVAVIVPVYNRAQTVLRTLASIRDQGARPHQVVIVNDGSSDDTLESTRKWIFTNNLDGWHVATQRNLGAGAARNRGLAESQRCEFVAFLDSDDCWPADFLDRAVGQLSADRSAVACTADRLTFYYANGKQKFRPSIGLASDPTLWLLEHGAGIGSATLFRLSAIEKRGGYNPAIPTGQDLALFLPISTDGSWLHAPGEPVYFHSGQCDSSSEAGNLHQQFHDCHRRWANIQQEFLESTAAKAHSAYGTLCHSVAKSWSRAARRYSAMGQRERAKVCRRRAARCKRFAKLGQPADRILQQAA